MNTKVRSAKNIFQKIADLSHHRRVFFRQQRIINGRTIPLELFGGHLFGRSEFCENFLNIFFRFYREINAVSLVGISDRAYILFIPYGADDLSAVRTERYDFVVFSV